MKPTPKMEASMKKAFATASAGNGILSESAFNEAFTWWGEDAAKIIARKARKDLIESLVEEVGGMKKEAPPKNSILVTYEFSGTLSELSSNISYNQALQDVIKLLERKI